MNTMSHGKLLRQRLIVFRLEAVAVTLIELICLPLACLCSHLCW